MKKIEKLVDKIVKSALKTNANSTTSIMAFQPKTPVELEKFKKFDK